MEYGATGSNEYDEEARLRNEKLQRQVAEAAVEAAFAYDDPADGWQSRALCGQTDPEAFFPEVGGSASDAKKICERCQVRSECLEAALALNYSEDFGICGGTTKEERQKMRKARASREAQQQAS